MLVFAVAMNLMVVTPMQAAPTQVTRSADTVFVALDEMVQTALLHNLRLRSAQAENDGIRSYGTSTRSRFDPVLNVGGDTENNGFGGQLAGLLPTGGSYLLGSIAPTVLPGEPLYPNALVATISQPLLRGFGWQSTRNSIRAVDEGVAASRARLSRTRSEIAATIRVAYAMLVERHRQEAIANGSVQRAEELRVAYSALRELEKITRVDLITAQLGVASRTANLLALRRERRDAEDVLVFAVYGQRAPAILARDGAVIMPRDTAVSVPSLAPVDSAITLALRARDDVEAARHDATRARYQSQVARNGTLPTLDFYAAFTSTVVTPGLAGVQPLRETRVQDNSFGIVFSRPLRNMGANAERHRTSAAVDQAAVAVTEAENTVRAEVRSTYREIELGVQQVELSQQASTLAREQYNGGRERLTLGLTDIFRVLQYDEQVSRMESAEASARLALATAVARYWLAMGVQ